MVMRRFFSCAYKIKPKLNYEHYVPKLAQIQSNCRLRGRVFDSDEYLTLYSQLNALSTEIEQLNERKRTAKIGDGEAIKDIRAELKAIQCTFDQTRQRIDDMLSSLPNETSPQSPIGKDCKILKSFGTKPQFNTSGLNHIDVGKALGIFDFEQAARVVGSKWVYLKHNGAVLENALVQYALGKLLQKGFQLVIPPDVCDINLVAGCGYNPRDNGTDTVVYQLENSNLVLAATSEILLAGLHAGTRLEYERLPLRYAAISHCFRPEAGHYGRDARGLYRLHQFTKVEMFAYSSAVNSESTFDEFLDIQQEIVLELGLHGRLVEMATHELGNSAFRKVDIEVEMPMRGEWGEVSSASNCTDYQSKRLCMTCYDRKRQQYDLHTLNATALAVPRILQALIECNYCPEQGVMSIPKALHPFTFGLIQIEQNCRTV